MRGGFLLVDKPEGYTSHDVVATLRRCLGERRIGHAGTLDPMATGLLPVFVGRATRAVEFAAEGEKEYLATLRLGTVTDTQDLSGTVLSQAEADCSPAELSAVLERFRGPIAQVPPMYSAIKQGGKKLYELARRGIEVERAPRQITIFALELLERQSRTDFLLRVSCSKGTYVRTLCHDIGKALGCGGCMAALRRTRVAGFSVEAASPLADILSDENPARFLRPVEDCFSHYPDIHVPPEMERKIRNGQSFPWEAAAGTYRVFSEAGEFLMLGRCGAGSMTTIKSFFEV